MSATMRWPSTRAAVADEAAEYIAPTKPVNRSVPDAVSIALAWTILSKIWTRFSFCDHGGCVTASTRRLLATPACAQTVEKNRLFGDDIVAVQTLTPSARTLLLGRESLTSDAFLAARREAAATHFFVGLGGSKDASAQSQDWREDSCRR
jgi:hypothetical protein